MATLTVYPAAGTGGTSSDARVYRSGVNEIFATIRNGIGNLVDATTTNSVCVQILCSTTLNQFDTISRGVFSFDTSALKTNTSISSATISFNGTNKANSLSAGIATFLVAGVTMGSAGTPAITDYEAVARTAFCTGTTYTNLSAAGYNDFALNASGIANITKNGISQFSTQWDWDLNNSFGGTWTTGSQQYIFVDFADIAGTTTDPKLAITYTPTDLSVHFFSRPGFQ